MGEMGLMGYGLKGMERHGKSPGIHTTREASSAMGACLSYLYLRVWLNEKSPRQPRFWPEGMCCCALFGIVGLSLDNLSRCAVAHLHNVHAGLQGIAATTVEVICL